MSTFHFKTPLAILLLVMMLGNPALAIEQDSELSWWEKSKQLIVAMWNSTTQTLAALVKQSSETASTQEKDVLFAQVWNDVTPTLEEVLQLEEERETLPDSAWIMRDKTDNLEDINELLDEAVAILSISSSDQTRQRIRLLERKIREMKQTISQYRQEQISAPVESTWFKTVEDYEVKIKQLNERIDKHYEEIAKLKSQFAQELAENGLSISQEQLEVLLSSVVGDDIIQTSIVYDNVKQISQQLMTLTINSGEDIEISQRYYGMYTVLLKTLLHMQQTFINNIDGKYLPKINQIVADVQDTNAITRNLLRGERDKNRRRHLAANLEAQKLTLKTAALYKRHLIGQRGKMVKAMDKTVSDLQIAQNTYKTVRLSGELVNLLRTSQKSFDLLLNIQVPELLVFENKQMKQEFAILSQKLAE
jgi:DNA-binding transcriptional regulator YbjK